MMSFRRFALCLLAGSLLGLLLVPAVVGAQTEPEPKKLLAISMLPRLDPMPTGSDLTAVYVEAVDLAYNAGARGDFFSKHWNEFEPTAGKFVLSDILNTANYIGEARGFDEMLGIQVINTVSREVPPDLKDEPFDSPKMQTRFRALIDALAPAVSHHFRYLSIGNEVDVYLAQHNEWDAYKIFYDDAVAYVHQKLPWLKVGVTVTFDGTTRNADQVKKLNEMSDIYILTYYPLNPDFTVRDPNAPLTDFPIMVTQAGGRPLILQEVGYPASEVLGSSEQKQATFVTNVYQAWGKVGDQLRFLSFFLMHDIPKATCDQLVTYYNLPNNKNFYEYLCTLGFRKADGTPRLAWQAFVDGAQAAGFPK